MSLRMNNHFDEVTGAATGVTVWILTHLLHFPMLQVHTSPLGSELLIGLVRMITGIITGIVTFIIIHYLKKWFFKE